VFGRNRSAQQTAEPAQADGAAKEGGKGRPTPKRRDAERGRRRAIAAPKGRKEAYRRSRERSREERARSMAGLRAGDERHFPPRDRGPVRRYARDFVDSRRSVGEFFLPFTLLILALFVVGAVTNSNQVSVFANSLWLAMASLLVLDSIYLVMRLSRGLRRSLPDESHRGAGRYAVLRSIQMRRLRVPPPRVRPGSRRV
jgi:Protein of unknown function (DUF3043)